MTELLTAQQWCRRKRVVIADADGWRHDGTPLSKPIDEADFEQRMAESTVWFVGAREIRG